VKNTQSGHLRQGNIRAKAWDRFSFDWRSQARKKIGLKGNLNSKSPLTNGQKPIGRLPNLTFSHTKKLTPPEIPIKTQQKVREDKIKIRGEKITRVC